MLENINSVYILQWIFSFLKETKTLKIISTNNSLKEKFSVDIIEYKKFAKKYVIKDKNGNYEIKSPINNIVYYEGGYINGKKNGYGKEYKLMRFRYSDFFRQNELYLKEININNLEDMEKSEYFKNIRFIEESKKDILNNKGDGFLYYINLEYEGEFKNGLHIGRGKQYDWLGNLMFEGEFKDCMWYKGKSLMYNFKKLILEREISNLDDLLNGIWKEKEYDERGNIIFEGEYKNRQKWNGKGKEFLAGNLLFEGEYENGKRWNGKGKELLNLDITFEGEYINGRKYGKEYDPKGNVIYEGDYIDNKKFNGKGKEFYINGKLRFDGEYILGQKKGKEYDNDGNIIFEGEYLNGLRWKGIIKESNIKFDCGNYKGKEYDNNGIITFEGEFSSGKKLKGKEKIYDRKNNYLFDVDFDKNKLMEKRESTFEIYSTYEGNNGSKIEIGKEVNFKNNFIFEGEFSKGIRLKGIIKIYDNLNIECNENKNDLTMEEKRRNNNIVLKFESEIKNGEISGKGKEYDQEGNLMFEGEYSRGVRNGKGKEFSIFKMVTFEGEYQNGKRLKGIGYDLKGNLSFEAYYMNEQYLNGKLFKDNYVVFTGEIINNQRWNGYGNEYDFQKNTIFEGQYINGVKLGKECNLKGSILYEGTFKNNERNERNGKGKEFDENKNIIFEGEYVNDKRWNGIFKSYKGSFQIQQEYKNGEKMEKIIMKEYFKNKLRFEGEFLNGKKNGEGKEYFKDKIIFKGEYLNGKRNGFGTEYNFDGGKFFGKFRDGVKWDGTGYDKDDKIDYEIINGCGIIKEYYDGKLIYEGEYSNGKRHGIGKEYDYLTSKLKYEGRFVYGKKICVMNF